MGPWLLILLSMFVATQSAVSVEFKSEALVKGPEILLSDVAGIRSDDPALTRELASVRIGRAAIPGYNITIPLEHVRVSVLKPFYDRGLDLLVSGARSVQVKTDSRTLYGVSLSEQLRKCLYEKLPWPKSKIQVNFTGVPDLLVIPNVKDYAIALEPASDCDWRGSEPMQAVLSEEDGAEIKRFSLTVRIKVFEIVCVADKKLKRKAVIGEEDIRLETRDITEIRKNTYMQQTELLGKTLTRTILAGAVISDDMIEIPPLVRRGDKVKIVAREKSAMVTGEGVARKDGRMGEKIQVRNSLNNKLVDAWVSGQGEVNLDYQNGGVL